DEVPHADPVSVSVAPGYDDLEVRIREFRALRDRQGPSVDRMESVRRKEVRQVARASDPGDDQDVPRLELEPLDRGLKRRQRGRGPPRRGTGRGSGTPDCSPGFRALRHSGSPRGPRPKWIPSGSA